MLQNEATDSNDDLEHFEDIPDNDDNQEGNGSNKDHATEPGSESGDDADTSLDKSNSDSEEDNFSESDDILGVDGLEKPADSRPTSDQEMHKIQGRTLPGGYSPRHREPGYWYDLVCTFELEKVSLH